MIAEMYTYCTSVLARNKDCQVIHVRNLDFGFRDAMKKLVVHAIYKKGERRVPGHQIAGFLGAYTG